MRKALIGDDMGAAVNEFNLVLSSLPYDELIEALKKGGRLRLPEEAMGEWPHRSAIKPFLLGAGFHASKTCGDLGSSDLELAIGERGGRVLRLKASIEGQSDKGAAKAALAQINEKSCAGRHREPLLAGLAANKSKRIIAAWTSQDGLSPENMPKQAFQEPEREPSR